MEEAMCDGLKYMKNGINTDSHYTALISCNSFYI
jgi:hypothetical protein